MTLVPKPLHRKKQPSSHRRSMKHRLKSKDAHRDYALYVDPNEESNKRSPLGTRREQTSKEELVRLPLLHERRAPYRRNPGKPSTKGSDPERGRREEIHLITELMVKDPCPRPSRTTRKEGQSPAIGGTEHEADALKEARSRRKTMTRSKTQQGLQEGKGEKNRINL